MRHQRSLYQGTDKGHGPFLPLLLLAIAFVVLVGFQALQLGRERDLMIANRESQDQTMAESRKVRAQLDTIARGTKQLALAGNHNALTIVEQLERQGVQINLATDSAPADPGSP